MQECTDLFVANGCALHDLQNALRWGIEPLLKKDMLHDMHIILEALRSSASKLHQALPAHLRSLVVQRQPADLAGHLERQQFWTLLGVDAAVLDRVQEVDPWFHDGQLHVNPIAMREQDDPDELSVSILYLLPWRAFTDSRFLSMSEASRGLLGSMCCGLSVLVERARAQGPCHPHLNGFQRLSPDNIKCFVVLALVGTALSELMCTLMADDRLLRQKSSLEAMLADEIQAAHALPEMSLGVSSTPPPSSAASAVYNDRCVR